MILSQNKETGYWTEFKNRGAMRNVHNPDLCSDRGCAIHNHPSKHDLSEAPLNWRGDRSILERICKHGIGHPDLDAAKFLRSIGQEYQNIHGCDGCCVGISYDEVAEPEPVWYVRREPNAHLVAIRQDRNVAQDLARYLGRVDSKNEYYIERGKK